MLFITPYFSNLFARVLLLLFVALISIADVSGAMASSSTSPSSSVLVAGATGAIGREFVLQAINDPFFTRVVALSRRDIPQEQWNASWPGIDVEKAKAKLEVFSMDWEGLCADDEAKVRELKNAAPAFSGHQYAVNLLGSTRKDAGSAEAFHRYDFDYYQAFVKAVKLFNPSSSSSSSGDYSSTIKHFQQISSTGANANSWFLYMKTKGLADEMLMRSAAAFPKVSFFRPGLLERKDKARTNEKIFSFFSSAMPVERVAAAMINDIKSDAGRTLGTVATCQDAAPADKTSQRIFANGDIEKLTPAFDKKGGACCTSADDTKEGAKQQRSDL